ncbi:CoA transferase [Clostridium botulinum]|uniref:Carnitine dehydratase n=1 Tax=Clostridium botulinum C/D str. DC5 TaxID=1443128 RepID=A0A0A0IC47_CLOBO|nr:CoA transferase [Clostridium botulinum]KGM98492.1 carnitine dehydratase [Clostridium botulinum C/D str. DC5]KOC51847.1 carnitine dehydratase [Clostridium botulinum]KOC53593.1 carnitine dehydratase [Clostridium botulinum]MCD3234860.1 CoA transferase [Clostridium botulinum D/C]MCD3240759.1 CoA transferase [Clostridium botulinum D/C]
MEMSKLKRPLKGLKVLDFTIALAGVYVSWQLADMGAEVWKVERYGFGDQSRAWDPFINDMSTLYVSYNKNKKSIELNLKKEAGKQVIYDLVKEADIVVENFKSGSIDRLGLGYDKLKEINPKIVFLSLSGFGKDGPLAKLPCYDAIAAARGGFAGSNGEPSGTPMKAANANCDTLTGTHALNAVLMGLYNARKTGKGCNIDIAMADTVMISCGETAMDYFSGNYQYARFGNHDRFIAPYGVFEARDGWIVIIADTEEKWHKLCEAFGKEEWKNDPRFIDNEARIANKDELVKEIEKVTSGLKRNEAETILLNAGVPASEVLSFIEAYTSDHANKTECTERVNQDNIGLLRFYNNPLHFNDEKCQITKGAPLLGQHSKEILKGVGYIDEEIEKLYEDGVVGSTLI